MKFLIKCFNDFIGMCGSVKSSDFDFYEYVEKFGFNDSGSALEVAEMLNIKDCVIVII